MSDTLILGVGNTIRGDDSIGIHCVRKLREILPQFFEIKESTTAGLDLLSAIVGFRKVILIDAIQTPNGVVGQVYRLSLEEFVCSTHLSSTHAFNFKQLVALGNEVMGGAMPQVEVLAIEAEKLNEFSEELSTKLENQFDTIVENVRNEIDNIVYANKEGVK